MLRALWLGSVGEALSQPALRVLAGVDEVGVVERQLHRALHDVVDGLHAEHKRVVLVANLERCT